MFLEYFFWLFTSPTKKQVVHALKKRLNILFLNHLNGNIMYMVLQSVNYLGEACDCTTNPPAVIRPSSGVFSGCLHYGKYKQSFTQSSRVGIVVFLYFAGGIYQNSALRECRMHLSALTLHWDFIPPLYYCLL